MRTVVLAHTDARFAQPLIMALAGEGLPVIAVLLGEDPAEQILQHHPDLVMIQDPATDQPLTDRSLLEHSGVDLVYLLRRESAVPIIMLAVEDDEDRIVSAFEAGADDYLVHPVSVRELTARVSVIVRRIQDSTGDTGHVVRAGPVWLDIERHTATMHGHPLGLTVLEFALLETLASNKSYVLTRGELLLTVWGSSNLANHKHLTTYIRQLRRRIEADPATPRHIITVRGIGYRFLS